MSLFRASTSALARQAPTALRPAGLRAALATSPARAATHKTDDKGLPDPVSAGAHSSSPSGQRWGPGQKARLNVPLENTPLFLFVGFAVSVGLGTIGWNYMKSDDVRTMPGPDKDKWESNADPALVRDHPPKKAD